MLDLVPSKLIKKNNRLLFHILYLILFIELYQDLTFKKFIEYLNIIINRRSIIENIDPFQIVRNKMIEIWYKFLVKFYLQITKANSFIKVFPLLSGN